MPSSVTSVVKSKFTFPARNKSKVNLCTAGLKASFDVHPPVK
uniref:Uncharacterized protein n=1 Tax=Arundo donax TaxID=35708 RepID=A0A0A8YJT9_ARUDO